MEQRLTPEECRVRMRDIRRALAAHLGQKVLVTVRDGRSMMATAATLIQAHGKVCAQYRNYAKNGTPTATRRMYINPALVHTGEVSIDYFDDGV